MRTLGALLVFAFQRIIGFVFGTKRVRIRIVGTLLVLMWRTRLYRDAGSRDELEWVLNMLFIACLGDVLAARDLR